MPIYVTQQRVEKIGRPTGMDDQNIFAFTVTGFEKDFDFQAMVRDDMALLRQMPGIVDAAPIRQVPLSGSGSSTGFFSLPNQKGEESPANYYATDEHGINTLGTKLSAGATFDAGVIELPQGGQAGHAARRHRQPGPRERAVSQAERARQDLLRRPEQAIPHRRASSNTSTVPGWAGTRWIA